MLHALGAAAGDRPRGTWTTREPRWDAAAATHGRLRRHTGAVGFGGPGEWRGPDGLGRRPARGRSEAQAAGGGRRERSRRRARGGRRRPPPRTAGPRRRRGRRQAEGRRPDRRQGCRLFAAAGMPPRRGVLAANLFCWAAALGRDRTAATGLQPATRKGPRPDASAGLPSTRRAAGPSPRRPPSPATGCQSDAFGCQNGFSIACVRSVGRGPWR